MPEEEQENSFEIFHKLVFDQLQNHKDPKIRLSILQGFSTMKNLPKGAAEWLEGLRQELVDKEGNDEIRLMEERFLRNLHNLQSMRWKKDVEERKKLDEQDLSELDNPEKFWRNFENKKL